MPTSYILFFIQVVFEKLNSSFLLRFVKLYSPLPSSLLHYKQHKLSKDKCKTFHKNNYFNYSFLTETQFLLFFTFNIIWCFILTRALNQYRIRDLPIHTFENYINSVFIQ